MEEDDDDDDNNNDDDRYCDKSYTNIYWAWNSNRKSPYYKLEIIEFDTAHSLTQFGNTVLLTLLLIEF